ncbi:MAG: hypothetical protein GY817_04685 [bacterium]|nr:hypothetical protein [bacterium]
MTMNKLLETHFKASIAGINTAMPALVKAFNADNKTCDVKPVFKKKYSDNEIVEYPLLTDVPIVYPQTKKAIISYPLEVDDYVLLVFNQRSIDRFKQVGGIEEHKDNRICHLNDAVAFVGVYPLGQGEPAFSDGLEIKFGDMIVKLYENGKVEIKNNGIELISLLTDFMTAVSNITVATSIGTQPIINKAEVEALKAQIQGLKK